MSINIDWSSREDENIYCTFRGEYNGIGFTINANWNSWDDWCVDSIDSSATHFSPRKDKVGMSLLRVRFVDCPLGIP